jgi:hypothetical protein
MMCICLAFLFGFVCGGLAVAAYWFFAYVPPAG